MAKIMLLSHLLGYPCTVLISLEDWQMENGATEWITNLIQHVVRQKKHWVEKKHVYCFKSDYERNSPRHKGLNENLFWFRMLFSGYPASSGFSRPDATLYSGQFYHLSRFGSTAGLFILMTMIFPLFCENRRSWGKFWSFGARSSVHTSGQS